MSRHRAILAGKVRAGKIHAGKIRARKAQAEKILAGKVLTGKVREREGPGGFGEKRARGPGQVGGHGYGHGHGEGPGARPWPSRGMERAMVDWKWVQDAREGAWQPGKDSDGRGRVR